MMTQTARNLGMKNTTFRNASGLPNDEQLTTARDMAILATHVMQRLSGILRALRNPLLHLQGPQVPQPQSAVVRLQGHRRHQDRLHAGQRLQPDRLGEARRQASGRRGARRPHRRPTRRRHARALRPALGQGLERQVLGKLADRLPHGLVFPAAALQEARLSPSPRRRPSMPLGGPQEEGDTSGPGDSVPASLSPNRPAPRNAARSTQPYAGQFHVQVGAYTSLVRCPEPPRHGSPAGALGARRAHSLRRHLHARATRNGTARASPASPSPIHSRPARP